MIRIKRVYIYNIPCPAEENIIRMVVENGRIVAAEWHLSRYLSDPAIGNFAVMDRVG